MSEPAPPPAAAAAPVPSPPPPTARDPWAWASGLAVLLLLARCVGGRLGEPVAEDFDMLHRALLEPTHTWLDGGGTNAFWRPLSFQGYFALCGRLMLAHPVTLALVHAALLTVAVVLLYRTFRLRLPGPWAAALATFPLLAESARVLLAWPSQFGDLGALLFSALALHEAARRRLPGALVALALALLSKEVAAVTAVLLPFVPGLAAPFARPRGERARWAIACGAVLVAWGAAYAWVRAHAGLALPHGLESDAGLLHTSVATKLAWAWRNSLRAALGLGARAAATDLVPRLAVDALLVVAALGFVLRKGARQRLARVRPWILWGGAWFLLGAAVLAPVYPWWAPARSVFAGVGLGVAALLVLRAAHPLLAAALVALRVGLVLASPGPPAVVTPEPVDRGEFVDFGRVARLELFLSECRTALRGQYPALAAGSTVGFRNLPLATEYAFGGPHAVQVWYLDPTLRWIAWPTFQARPDTPAVALLDYQPGCRPVVALLTPAALRHQMRGVKLLEAGQWPPALAELDSAAAAQRDRQAIIFLGDNAGRRAYCLAQLGRFPEAESDARQALAASPADVGARFVLAAALAVRKDKATALAELDTLLAQSPRDADARELKARLTPPRRAP